MQDFDWTKRKEYIKMPVKLFVSSTGIKFIRQFYDFNVVPGTGIEPVRVSLPAGF